MKEFKDYLSSNNLSFDVFLNDSEIGGTCIILPEINLASFEPPDFEPTIVSKSFTIEHDCLSVGAVHLILKTDVMRSAVELNASKIEDDSILFIVNDTPEQRSSEHQDDTMRQLLACKKCNALRSPSEVSCRYELIDEILVNRELPKKDMDLEVMKRNLERIEREAKLYPVGREQELPKASVDNRFCDNCGGITITGKTCGRVPWKDTESGYPEGNAKRYNLNEFTIFDVV